MRRRNPSASHPLPTPQLFRLPFGGSGQPRRACRPFVSAPAAIILGRGGGEGGGGKAWVSDSGLPARLANKVQPTELCTIEIIYLPKLAELKVNRVKRDKSITLVDNKTQWLVDRKNSKDYLRSTAQPPWSQKGCA